MKKLLILLTPLCAVILLAFASNNSTFPQEPLYQSVQETPYTLYTDYESKGRYIETPVEETVEEPPEVYEPQGHWVWARVTAYCPCEICCGKTTNHPAYGITSTDVDVLSGSPNDAYGIAADPQAVSYGTQIYVPGYWESLQRNRTFVPSEMTEVDDTGGAMRQSWRNERVIHLDVRYRTHAAAKKWGVRWMRVFVYDD